MSPMDAQHKIEELLERFLPERHYLMVNRSALVAQLLLLTYQVGMQMAQEITDKLVHASAFPFIVVQKGPDQDG
jgi:hypothetical protein